MTRQDVTFISSATTCAAWFYPSKAAQPGPVIVMAHGLGGVKEMRLDAYAEKFLDQGYSCLVFDYRHFGGSGGQPRQLLDIDLQLEDWTAAVAYARTLEGVDPEQVVLWGTSFGGGHVILTASRDPRLAAVIAQCPFTDGLASLLAVSPLTSARLTARAVRNKVARRVGRAPVMVATSGAPGSLALMTAPDAEHGYLGLVPDGVAFENQVAASIGFDIGLHFPGRAAAKVTCPILFAVCETNSVAPAAATQRHARKAPRGEVRLYPEGHFDIYVGQAFEKVVDDQIAFLTHHVPTTGRCRTPPLPR